MCTIWAFQQLMPDNCHIESCKASHNYSGPFPIERLVLRLDIVVCVSPYTMRKPNTILGGALVDIPLLASTVMSLAYIFSGIWLGAVHRGQLTSKRTTHARTEVALLAYISLLNDGTP